jgi:uncharacterized membrane protein YkoI
MKHMRRTLLLCIGLLLMQATQASPQISSAQPAALKVAQRDGPSLGEAVEQVRRQYQGRIVSAETEMRGNREVHVIKVLTDDGKVKTVRIPGRVRNGRG